MPRIAISQLGRVRLEWLKQARDQGAGDGRQRGGGAWAAGQVVQSQVVGDDIRRSTIMFNCTAYATNLVSAGGAVPYSYSITAGALPRPLTLTSSGLVSGAPFHIGTYTFTLEVRDAALATASRSCSMQVVAGGGAVLSSVGGLRNAGTANDDGTGAVRFELANTLPYDVYGRVALVFSREDKEDDQEVSFSSGGRTADFIIRAGETRAEFTDPKLSVLKGEGRGQIQLIFTMTDKDGQPVLAEQQQ